MAMLGSIMRWISLDHGVWGTRKVVHVCFKCWQLPLFALALHARASGWLACIIFSSHSAVNVCQGDPRCKMCSLSLTLSHRI